MIADLRVYSLDDFEPFEARGQALSMNGARVGYERQEFNGELPGRVVQIMERDAVVRERFARTPGEHADKSESGIDGSLACLLATRGCSGPEVEAALRISRARAGVPDAHKAADYYQRTVERALAVAKAPDKSEGGDAPAEALHTEDEGPSAELEPGPDELSSVSLTTDVANAARLAREFAMSLRYVGGMGWIVWSDTHWEPSETRALKLASRVGRLIHREVVALEREAARCADEDKRARIAKRAQKLAAWAQDSESNQKVTAALNLARPLLEIPIEKLDADPWVLNVLNGTLDLKTGKLHPHRRQAFLTKLARVRFDPNATSDEWTNFLQTAIPHEGTRTFSQKAAGYSLVGEPGEDVLLFVHGATRTGKGTFQSAIASTMGNYAVTAGLEDLTERNRRGSDARPELVALRGARLVTIYETRRGLRLNAALVKTLCGSDPIRARDLFEKPIEFLPQFTLWIASNHRPRVPEDDDACWERIREVPFLHTVAAEKRRPELRKILSNPKLSGPAILRWMVDGCIKWQGEGLHPPDTVLEATQDFRNEMDPLREFIRASCDLGADQWVAAAGLRAAYESWCAENGEEPVRGDTWGSSLRRHVCERRKRNGVRGWAGISLLAGAAASTES